MSCVDRHVEIPVIAGLTVRFTVISMRFWTCMREETSSISTLKGVFDSFHVYQVNRRRKLVTLLETQVIIHKFCILLMSIISHSLVFIHVRFLYKITTSLW